MTQPLALVCYERLLPGSQLINRLQDLGYRVQTVPDADALPVATEEQKPMLVILDLVTRRADAPQAIRRIKGNPATQHVPVIAFAEEKEAGLRASGQQAGAELVVMEGAILTHLQQFLEQALRVD